MTKNELIKTYTDRGHKVIPQNKWTMWDQIVPIRVSDIYHGMEVNNALTILESYKEEKDLRKVRKIFDDAEHSGWSAGLVARIIMDFSDDYKVLLPTLGYEIKK